MTKNSLRIRGMRARLRQYLKPQNCKQSTAKIT